MTSRNLRDRLNKELERNVAMRVEETDSADTFIVCGRGPLHLTILIETMRREGFEFLVGPPDVIYKVEDGKRLEPFESVDVEVQEEYVGSVVDLLGRRKGVMTDMGSCNTDGMCSVTYTIPTRGLLGIRSAILTATRGTAIMTTTFAGYQEFAGDLPKKDQGSLLAFETGKVSTYGVEGAQDRGKLFVRPGDVSISRSALQIQEKKQTCAALLSVCQSGLPLRPTFVALIDTSTDFSNPLPIWSLSAVQNRKSTKTRSLGCTSALATYQ